MTIIKIGPKKSFLTILEVMIALVVITLIGTSLFSSFRPLLEKRKFSSDFSRLSERALLLRSLAIYQEKDIEVELSSQQEESILSSYDTISSLKMVPFTIYCNDQKVDSIRFTFLSTGEVEPKELIRLSYGKENRFFSFQQ